MKTQSTHQIRIFNELYEKYYGLFAWRCERSVKDEVVASGMVHDAFLRVWLLRDELSVEDVYGFLKAQLKKSIFAYYDMAKNKFHTNLFSLDELENRDFLLVDHRIGEEEIEEPDLEDDTERKTQWQQLTQLMDSLPDTQQQLIKLCLKYNFSYEHIAFYLGGISDYAVGKKVEALLESLKRMLTDGQKLELVAYKSSLTFRGSLDELQESILKMRNELAYSFEEVAKALGLSEVDVKVAYARACRAK